MARRGREERPIPAHPYRDAAIVYGIMAAILVVLTGVTGGSLIRAVGAAAIFWLLATAWSWWKFRGRIRDREAALAAKANVDPSDAEGTVRSPEDRADALTNGAVSGNGRGADSGRTEA